MTGQSDAAIAAYRTYIARYPAAVLHALETGERFSLTPLKAWSFPLLVLAQGRMRLVDQGMFEQTFVDLYRAYSLKGWTGEARIDSVEAQSVAPGLVWLQATGARCDAHGHVLEHWDSGYLMRESEGSWHTILLTDAPRPRPDGQDLARWFSMACDGSLNPARDEIDTGHSPA